jgi:hypothetical protein
MRNSQHRLTASAPHEPNQNKSAPLTRTVKPKTKAQERAEKKLLTDRQAWDIQNIDLEQSAAQKKSADDGAHRWVGLLAALDKHAAGSWVLLDKALAPFCMGAPGPMNPKTGQYVTEIRMIRNQPDQVEKVLAGIHTLLPFLKIYRGGYEFRIKCLNAKIREKNWLSISKDGKAQVLSSVHPAASFDDVRSALIFILENRPAADSLD